MSFIVPLLLACSAPPTVAESIATEIPSPPTREFRAELTPEGGIVEFGAVRVDLPAGAVTEVTEVLMTVEDPPTQFVDAGPLYVFEPHVELLQPATVTLPLPGTIEDARVYTPNASGGFFQPQPQSVDDVASITLSLLSSVVVAGNDHIEEVLHVIPVAKVDVLFVVDNSCSMIEEQMLLSQSIQPLIDNLESEALDWHIGAVSTDMDDQANGKGKLRMAPDGSRWIDRHTPDPADTFRYMVILGTAGSYNERGRDAAHVAMITTSPRNQGFFRDDAALHYIFVSDDDDASTFISMPDFKDWMDTLRPNGETVQAHAIVGLSGACFHAPGPAYEELALYTGGQIHDICEPSWAPMLDNIGLEASGHRRTFFLLQEADPATIEVTVLTPDGVETWQDPAEWTYTPTGPSITFNGDAPEPGSEVRVAYLPM